MYECCQIRFFHIFNGIKYHSIELKNQPEVKNKHNRKAKDHLHDKKI